MRQSDCSAAGRATRQPSGWPSSRPKKRRRRDLRRSKPEAAKQPAATAAGRLPAPVDIAELQRSLNAIGLNTGSSDGKSGARTQEMVRAFQLIIGEPPTGEATHALLNSCGRQDPRPRQKRRACSAWRQRRTDRDGLAMRSGYTRLGLTFAPANSDALLVLGDLYRDRNDYDGARRLYELLQRNGGSAADVGRERLATLPRQQETPAKDSRCRTRRDRRLAPHPRRRPLGASQGGRSTAPMSGQARRTDRVRRIAASARFAWKCGTAGFHLEGTDR